MKKICRAGVVFSFILFMSFFSFSCSIFSSPDTEGEISAYFTIPAEDGFVFLDDVETTVWRSKDDIKTVRAELVCDNGTIFSFTTTVDGVINSGKIKEGNYVLWAYAYDKAGTFVAKNTNRVELSLDGGDSESVQVPLEWNVGQSSSSHTVHFYDITSEKVVGTLKVNAGKYLKKSEIATKVKKTGYSFLNWYKDSLCTTPFFDENDEDAESIEPISYHITLWGRGEKIELARYTVTFEANADDANGATESITGEEDETVTLTANGFSREGYTFALWNTEADGSGTSYQDGDSLTLTEDITLYAQWEEIQHGSLEITVTLPEYSDSDITISKEISGTTLTLVATSGYDSYSWEFDGTADNSQTGNSFTKDLSSLSAGTYDVYLEATKGGKVYSYFITVKVSGVPSSGGMVNGANYSTVGELAAAIENLPDDSVTTLSLGSNISSYDDLHKIGDALQNKGNCSITLDLSGCTTLTVLGEAFNNKQAITKVIFPASLKTIENNAFYNCQKLTEVEFASGSQLESIGEMAFYQSKITAIKLPATLKSIGKSAFFINSLTSLEFTDTSHTWKITGTEPTISEYEVTDSAQNALYIKDSAKYWGEWTRND